MSIIWILIVAAIFSGIATLASMIAVVYAFLAHSKVVGLQNSTHQVSWVPLDEEIRKDESEPQQNKELQQKFNDMYTDLESEHV